GKFEMIKHNPLAGIYYIPANIINSNNMSLLLLEQIVYMAIFSVIIYFMWKRGIKHYESQGG
ncbi:MAG: ABC-2 family transporter protein, partial [Finegoldia magna]|nr:ABC-2 family transporter protein [Finegoldia magna]